MLESKVQDAYPSDSKRVLMGETEQPEAEAKLAFAFLERWSLVMGATDGEDSAGRQKLKLMEPQELVDRAFTIAHLAIDKARSTGLIHQVPSFSDLEK